MAVSEINFGVSAYIVGWSSIVGLFKEVVWNRKKKDYNFKVLIECHNFWLQLIQFVISDFGNIF